MAEVSQQHSALASFIAMFTNRARPSAASARAGAVPPVGVASALDPGADGVG